MRVGRLCLEAKQGFVRDRPDVIHRVFAHGLLPSYKPYLLLDHLTRSLSGSIDTEHLALIMWSELLL